MKSVAVLLAAAVAFLSIGLGMGAWSFGEVKTVNACRVHTQSLGGGLDAALQRIVLDGLNGAACELHASREELVLSLRPSSERQIRWDSETIERALRAGLLRAIDESEDRGDLPGFAAFVLRAAARNAPIKYLIEGGSSLFSLLG